MKLWFFYDLKDIAEDIAKILQDYNFLASPKVVAKFKQVARKVKNSNIDQPDKAQLVEAIAEAMRRYLIWCLVGQPRAEAEIEFYQALARVIDLLSIANEKSIASAEEEAVDMLED